MLFDQSEPLSVPTRSAALLLIDPQRSFTDGAWMRSIGPGADADTAPIRLAFEACARRAAYLPAAVEAGLTRCPFPPGSFGWDRRLSGVLGSGRPYFLKPGNSAFFPPGNGFSDWLEGCMRRGKTTLVVAGCTLNSCVRVTALQVQDGFGGRGLQVAVDLSLCGARSRNYLPSRRYGGASAVSAAVSQMKSGGILVARQVCLT
jgi:nicotinamidase-related amidase